MAFHRIRSPAYKVWDTESSFGHLKAGPWRSMSIRKQGGEPAEPIRAVLPGPRLATDRAESSQDLTSNFQGYQLFAAERSHV